MGEWVAKYTKTPDDVLDYVNDWSDWLGADTISTSVHTLETGITEDSESETTTTTTIWISGGDDQKKYRVRNKIVTTGGRTATKTTLIAVEW